MKFGVRKAEPTHEPVIEEAPTKKYEVLPRKLPRESGMKFDASEAELTLQYVPQRNRLQSVHRRRNEVRARKAELPSSSPELVRTESSPTVGLAGKRNEVRLEESRAPPKAHHQSEMKFGTNKGGAKFPHGMKFGTRAEESSPVE
ncbi:hypothetical protein COCNU_06G007930 [Cocos nucifera]|uniref:Uncharacterized protein n=1 Tax=Cocos nucifera TaxID=13894 RepID=A0A8K0IB33_COCNU|nr:hypothetical protein COCNU_06G007930 [Cocos nucifera]